MFRGERVKKRGLSMLPGSENSETPSSDVTALCRLLACMLAQRHAETKLHQPISQFEIPKRGTLALKLVQESASDTEPAMYSYTKGFGYSEIWYFAPSSVLPEPEAIREKLRCSGVPVNIINTFNADAILVPLPLQSERRRRIKGSDLVAQKGKFAAEMAQAVTQEVRNGFRTSCNLVNKPSPHLKRFEQHFYTLLKIRDLLHIFGVFGLKYAFVFCFQNREKEGYA
jgi:hypothetical protein